MNVVVEAWRFLTHSYVLCSQALELEWIKSGKVNLHHVEAPLDHMGYMRTPGMLPPDDTRLLKSLPPVPDNFQGIRYRHFWPPDFRRGQEQHLVVFMTCEILRINEKVLSEIGLVLRTFATANAWIVTPSEYSRQGLIRTGFDGARIKVIPHGVDTKLYCPERKKNRDTIRRALGIGEGFAFLHVSAMTPNKGLDILFRSFASVAREKPDALLVLKGTDTLYQSKERMEQALSFLLPQDQTLIRERMIYLGEPVPDEDMANLYGACDAYVAPYLGEGFNMPVLYAAATGIPIVTTLGGPTDEFTTGEFTHQIPSYLCSWTALREEGIVPDRLHFEAGMLDAMQNSAWREHAAIAGPKYVQNGFTWAQVAQQYLDWFATLG